VAIFAIWAVINSGCGVYSFTGTTLPPTIKTLSVGDFFNETDGSPANLGQTFTNSLRDYFQSNSSLIIVQDEGDIQLEGTITGYRLSPIAPTASRLGNSSVTTASMTRLTITVKTAYTNTVDEDQSFNRDFSFYADFDSNTESLASVENDLIQTIFEQIIQDIFNATVAVW